MARILTPSEQRALAYQSQGSFPNSALVLNTYSLYDTLTFTASTTSYTLFGQTSGQSSKWLTNMKGAGQIPGGQSFQAYQMSLGFNVSNLEAGTIAPVVNLFYSVMRSSIWTFARNNEDFSAQFPGSKFLPAISFLDTYATPTLAAQHVGDFGRSAMCYKFLSPIVIGQNTGFSVTVEFESAVAGDILGERLQVFLDGGLVKKQTA